MSIETRNGAPEGWSAKESWQKRGTNFLVEVYHYWEGIHDFAPGDGGHRWNVYAYIYPDHPHFAKFEGLSLYQDAAKVLHLHLGATHISMPFYEGKQTCVKVGSDYNHLHDDFTFVDSGGDHPVFQDAQELFDQLQHMANEVTV